jgi:hypothetical protein
VPRRPYSVAAYSRDSLAPHEDVVVGVAHTSLYGDIVIGIPYNKRHMFEQDNNHHGASKYNSYNGPSFAYRNSVAPRHPTIGNVSVTPNYRRASVAVPFRNPYEGMDEVISAPSRYRPKKHYDDLEDEIDWPTRRPPSSVSSLRGRAQSVQRQLDGIPEFQTYSSGSRGRASSVAPAYSSPMPASAPISVSSYPRSYVGGSTSGSGVVSGLPPAPRRSSKPPVSAARQKVRDLLCKSKNDPRYFED